MLVRMSETREDHYMYFSIQVRSVFFAKSIILSTFLCPACNVGFENAQFRQTATERDTNIFSVNLSGFIFSLELVLWSHTDGVQSVLKSMHSKRKPMYFQRVLSCLKFCL